LAKCLPSGEFWHFREMGAPKVRAVSIGLTDRYDTKWSALLEGIA